MRIWHIFALYPGCVKQIVQILFILSSVQLVGQSYFYNTQQYGLRSTLLGGAVTAGSADHSMVFYNPAALRYAEDKSLDLALLMPNYSSYSYNDFLGNDQRTQSRDFSLNPTLITYSTDINDVKIVVTLLQRDRWDSTLNYSEETVTGNQLDSESFSYRYQGDETWIGIGSSFDIGTNLSLGISQFWSILGTDYQYNIQSERVDLSTGLQDQFFTENLDLNYSSILSMVTKIGAAYELGDQRFGLVITTPRYSPVSNSGRIESSTITVNQVQFNLSNVTDFSLSPDIKNGWEIGLGYANKLDDVSQIWANFNFISGVSTYDLFFVADQAERITTFESGSTSVANISIGYSRHVSDRTEFLSSVRTNFTNYENGPEDFGNSKIHIADNDRLHLAAGCKIDGAKSSVVIGLDWGFSFGESERVLGGFPNLERLNTQDAPFAYNSLTLLLTYEFLLDSMQKNVNRLFDRNE